MRCYAMTHRTLASLAALLLLAFPKANAQTTVTGHHLENTSVGFYGFSVNIPYNYIPYTPPKEKDFKIKTYGDMAWNNSLVIDRKAGFTALERLPFQSDYSGLVVSVVRCTLQIPSTKDKINYLQFLDKFVSWTIVHSKDDFLRDTRPIGDIYVGRVARVYRKEVTAAYIVLIPPHTILTFQAACAEDNKTDLMQDLDAAIATLDIGKRAKVSP